ncbi:MAG: M20/M25/M40 family metallo-hydrolase [Acidipila sp.]|nr:M20/M25/M40 family metallo-hydrolase [Acidipila sp.]
MKMSRMKRMRVALPLLGVSSSLLLFLLPVSAGGEQAAAGVREGESAKLIAAVVGPSPLAENLRKLTDEIGGRVPGTPANREAVAWGIAGFRAAGVDEVHTEKFTLPVAWSEGHTRLEIMGPHSFPVHVVSMGWSRATPENGIEVRVLDVGDGSEAEFANAGSAAKGALLLVHTAVLRTWADLFQEYDNAGPVLERSLSAGAGAVLWMSTREHGLLYRHMNGEHGELSRIPEVMLNREDALHLARSIAAGEQVRARLEMPNRTGGAFEVENVIAEIRGTDKAGEVVMLGAHLDSWELGTGALDNGCDAALVVEAARAIRAAGLHPRRTLRFVLWNGEEQGMLGSWAYARAHRGADLDHVAAYLNFDGGVGRITGYSTGGREEVVPELEEILRPVAAWGMNQHTFDVTSGSDHVDFLLEGVPTLDLGQEEGNYIVNYHASSDTLDKVDILQLKLQTAYAAVTMMGIANREQRLAPRKSRAEVEALIHKAGFDTYMKRNGMWAQWENGERGRQP